jgi:hypothetical protein
LRREWLALGERHDLRNRLATAAQHDRLAIFLDRSDQRGKTAFGF